MTLEMKESGIINDLKGDLIRGFTAQHIVFVVRAQEAIQFSEQPGINLRGALYHALIARFI
jgi:hypothetical protein